MNRFHAAATLMTVGLALTGCSSSIDDLGLPPGYSIQYNAKTDHFKFCMSAYFCPAEYFESYSAASKRAWAQYQYGIEHEREKPDADETETNWRSVAP